LFCGIPPPPEVGADEWVEWWCDGVECDEQPATNAASSARLPISVLPKVRDMRGLSLWFGPIPPPAHRKVTGRYRDGMTTSTDKPAIWFGRRQIT